MVGAGAIEHQRLDRPCKIEDEIRFIKPFRSKSNVVFELQPIGSQTQLTWHMHGSLPWFMFWMKPMMETFIGMDYARGLRMLKEWIETGKIQSQTTVKGVVPVGPLTMLGVRDKCSVADVGASMEGAFKNATQLFEQHKLPTNLGMISVYTRFDIKAGTFDYISGYLVPDATEAPSQQLWRWSLPAGRGFCVEHIGSYNHLGNAWSAANQIARYKKLKQSRIGTFELYKPHHPILPTRNCAPRFIYRFVRRQGASDKIEAVVEDYRSGCQPSSWFPEAQSVTLRRAKKSTRKIPANSNWIFQR